MLAWGDANEFTTKGGPISTKAGQFLPGKFSGIQISTSTSGKNRL
jgi:hypothetical protein